MHTYDADADDFGLDAVQAAFKKRSPRSCCECVYWVIGVWAIELATEWYSTCKRDHISLTRNLDAIRHCSRVVEPSSSIFGLTQSIFE